MEVHISNFRSIKEKSFSFKSGIHLISGESGAGKSTVLESIFWCLYGGKNIYPLGVEKPKKSHTKVRLVLPNISITRSKPPDKVTVEIEDNIYEHKEAEKVIERTFGSKLFWETSSYLKQDCRNNLLFGSKDEKLELVKEIIFGNDDSQERPEKYLTKVNDHLVSLEIKLNKVCGQIDLLSSDLGKPDEEIVRKQKFYSTLHSKKEVILGNLASFNEKVIKLEEERKKKEELKELKNELNEYPELSMERIGKWKTWSEMKDAKLGLEEFDETDGDLEEEKKKYYQIEEQKKKYDKFSKLCLELNIDFCEDSIQKEIKLLEERIVKTKKYQNYLEKMKKYTQLDNSMKESSDKLDQLEKIKPEKKKRVIQICQTLQIDPQGVDGIRSKIREMTTSFLSCPGCKKKLYLDSGTLREERKKCIDKKTLDSITRELNEIESFLDDLKRVSSKVNGMKEIMSGVEKPELVEKSECNLSVSEERLKKLKNIEFVSFDTKNIKSLRERIKNINLTNLSKKIENSIITNFEDWMESYTTPNNFDSYYEKYSRLKERYNYLNEMKYSEKDIEKIREKIKKNEEAMEKIKKYENHMEWEEKKKRLDQVRDERKRILQEKENCQKIRKIIEEESNSVFESLIVNFNFLLNQVVSEMFDDIRIEIGMFKKMKVGGSVKPQFNMKITVKGQEYDNLNFLSGGEKDRISMALTIATSSLSGSNVIMFDESMASLGEEMRTKSLDVIKRFVPDKIILNVCHFTVEGSYDTVVSM